MKPEEIKEQELSEEQLEQAAGGADPNKNVNPLNHHEYGTMVKLT